MKKNVVGIISLAILSVPAATFAVNIFSENMGTPSGTTSIATNVFQNSGLTFTGTGDVRNTTVSTGYTGVSGGGNVFLTNSTGVFFQIAGINSNGYLANSFGLSFGRFKSTTANDFSTLAVEYSTDGTTYSPLTYSAGSTGSGTAAWSLASASSLSIPNASNLRLRWRQTGTIVQQYRLDDVIFSGTAIAPLTVAPTSVSDVRVMLNGSATPGSTTITNTSSATSQSYTFGSPSSSLSLSTPASIAASGTGTVNIGWSDTTTVGARSGSFSVNNAHGNTAVDANDSVSVSGAVVGNRVVSSTPVALGRVIVGAPITGSSSLTSTAPDSEQTRVTIPGSAVVANADGIGAAAGTTTTFNGTTSTSRNLSGAFVSSGVKSGIIGLSVNGEGLAGEGVNAASISYSATALDKRIITASTVSLPTAFVNTTVSGSTSLSTTGSDSTTTRVSLATAVIPPNPNGIGMLAGGTGTLFDDAADTGTRTLSGSFSTAGPQSGSVGVGVATAENGGAGLTGEGSYSDVQVAYSGTALAHSNGSYNGSLDVNSLSVSTGSIAANSTYSGSITIHNLSGDSFGGGYTGDLLFKDFQYVSGTNDGTISISPQGAIAAGASITFNYDFFPNVEGAFNTTYKFTVGDNPALSGWADNLDGLSFNISGVAFATQAIPEPLTAAGVLLLSARVLGRRDRQSV